MNNTIDSTDLIYNRFDITYKNSFETYITEQNGKKYTILLHIEGTIGFLNLWGKNIPSNVINNSINYFINIYPELTRFRVLRFTKNYKNYLIKGFERILILPPSPFDVQILLTNKERQHIRYNIKHLAGDGELKIESLKNITNEIIETFFYWKKSTHDYDYNITPEEYINKYHVTDVILLSKIEESKKEQLAIIFFCACNRTIYLENISYNREYAKYSPGFLLYVYFVQQMIEEGRKYIFLGGAKQDYKRKFNSIERCCYTGDIFTKVGVAKMNSFFKENGILTVAIYGLGNMGKMLINVMKKFDVKVEYGIDLVETINDIKVIRPSDEWPNIDFIIISIKKQSKEIENTIDEKGIAFDYWEQIVDRVLKY